MQRILRKRTTVITEGDRKALMQEAYQLDRVYTAGSVILEEGAFLTVARVCAIRAQWLTYAWDVASLLV